MSHIVRFHVEGLAGREEPVTYELDRYDNIFFGLNGSGKTSLIKILNSAMANDVSIIRNVPFTAAQVEIYSINFDKVFKRSIEKSKEAIANQLRLRLPESPDSEMYEESRAANADEDDGLKWHCTPSKPDGVGETKWSHKYLPTSRLHIDVQRTRTYYKAVRSRVDMFTEDAFDEFFAESLDKLWTSYSSDVLSIVRQAQEEGLASILKAVISKKPGQKRKGKKKLPAETAYERVKVFLKRQGKSAILGSQSSFMSRYELEPTLQDVVQDIDSVESKIEKAMTVRNSLQNLITRMFSGNKEISFTDRSIEVKTSSGLSIGLASLSSGEKQLLHIFVQALLAEESTILIDEPEISLHVDWQRDLIEYMRTLNPKAQFVFATHSPEILANVSDKNIYRL